MAKPTQPRRRSPRQGRGEASTFTVTCKDKNKRTADRVKRSKRGFVIMLWHLCLEGRRKLNIFNQQTVEALVPVALQSMHSSYTHTHTHTHIERNSFEIVLHDIKTQFTISVTVMGWQSTGRDDYQQPSIHRRTRQHGASEQTAHSNTQTLPGGETWSFQNKRK